MDTAELDRISYLIIQAGIEIHKTLGPGLLESVYRRCMVYELQARNLTVNAQLKVPIRYKHLVLDGFYQLDHRAQVLSYLRLMDKRLGLLMNFHVERLVLGVDRIVNKLGWPASLTSDSVEHSTDAPEK
jgi:hypothetical protein